MNPITPDPIYLWSVASKKMAYGAAKMIVSYISSSAITTELEIIGIKFDPFMMQAAIITVVMAGMEWIHDLIKFKTGWNWL